MENLFELIDQLWDFGDPAATKKKFSDFLLQNKSDLSDEEQLIIKTQIARTLGLQRNFEEAHQLLDTIKSELTGEMDIASIRYHLERGRAYNSNKEKEKALKEFELAFNIAEKNDQHFFAVDAAHMLGIAHSYPQNLKWNEKAIEIAESGNDENAKKWFGSLYNNVGWTYHEQGNFEKALKNFEKGLAFRETKGNINSILIAKWCIARTFRSLGRIKEALQLQLHIQKEREKAILDHDGYVFEELGENYLLLEEKELSKIYFGKAYSLLSKDIWLKANEADRLQRIQSLSI